MVVPKERQWFGAEIPWANYERYIGYVKAHKAEGMTVGKLMMLAIDAYLGSAVAIAPEVEVTTPKKKPKAKPTTTEKKPRPPDVPPGVEEPPHNSQGTESVKT